MVLYLSEADVVSLLPIKKAIEEIEFGLKELGHERAHNQPRQRVEVSSTTLNVMSASITSPGVLGVKNYTTTPDGPQAYYLLFSRDGSLISMMEADELGRIRTGATTALATRLLSKRCSTTATLIGTGFQAETQLKALCEVKELEEVRIWGRNEEKVSLFCDRMQQQVNAKLVPYNNLAASLKHTDIVTTITSSSTPVLKGKLLSKGVHINAVGNNKGYEREIDSVTVERADDIWTDSLEQAKRESGDLILAADDGVEVWNKVKELTDIVTGKDVGRFSEEQVTLFKSNGIALEDLVVANYVYETALKSNVGKELDI